MCGRDGVGMVSWWSGRYRDNLEKYVIAVSCRLSPDHVPIFRQHRFTVVSLSDLCRIAFGRIGTLSGQIRFLITIHKIQIVLHSYWERESRDEIGWKRLNRDASGTTSDCCRDEIFLFYKFAFFPSRISRSWSDFWQISIGNGRIKVGSHNRECVNEALALTDKRFLHNKITGNQIFR